MKITGNIRKLASIVSEPIQYALPIGEESVELNPYIGKTIRLTATGNIQCIYCSRMTKKSFNQGYCFPCSQKLARCDFCIVRPEKCHYHQGTCREPEWGDTHCMQPHIVYLANSSGLKVGITRLNQVPTRWVDQGAYQALPIFQVKTRYHSGLVETTLNKHVSDKTNWRTMLKGNPPEQDLCAAREHLLSLCDAELSGLSEQVTDEEMTPLSDAEVIQLEYPVLEYPTKITSLNLEKTPTVEGALLGIKGQYLIFDIGVLNVRKYTGYEWSIEAE